MYQAQIYTPDDFKAGSSSEQHLRIYRATGESASAEWSRSWSSSLRYLFCDLGVLEEFDQVRSIVSETDTGKNDQLALSQVEKGEWSRRASLHLGSVFEPSKIEFNTFNKFWAASESMREVLVAFGEKRWIVVEWYSTA